MHLGQFLDGVRHLARDAVGLPHLAFDQPKIARIAPSMIAARPDAGALLRLLYHATAARSPAPLAGLPMRPGNAARRRRLPHRGHA